MKIIKLFILSLVFGIVACDNFEEINTNPNNPDDTDQNALFAHAQNVFFQNGAFITEALLHNYGWTQQFSRRNPSASFVERDQFSTGIPEGEWPRYYTSSMLNISDLLRRFEQEQNPAHSNRKAMTQIVKVLYTHYITDAYGGMPYSEAFKAFDLDNQVFLPKYDTQQEVYLSMLDELGVAAATLSTDTNQENFTGDLWYDGDVMKWKKLANSMRLRLAMRISSVDESTAKSVISEVLSKELFTSNDDNLIFRYLGSDYDSPMYNAGREMLHETAIAKNFIEFLEASGDPRLRIFFNKTTSGADIGTYVGIPISPDARDAVNLFGSKGLVNYNGTYSRGHAQSWFNRDFPETIITYAEILLLRAEIAQKGWSNENAKTLYEEGIRQSVVFYSDLYTEGVPHGEGRSERDPSDPIESVDVSTFVVTEAEINTLLAAPGVAFEEPDAINQIQIQQWIHHHRNPRELISNTRRTDVPNASSTPKWEILVEDGITLSRTSIPRRFTYPANEYTANTTNLENFLSIQGPDKVDTKLWWDVN